jgi:hypothetical protein
MKVEFGANQIIAGVEFKPETAGSGDLLLTRAKRLEFEDDFFQELARLDIWAANQNWVACPVSELKVVVSDQYRISRSQVPAWSGHAGYMQFPAWRVTGI